MRTAISTHEVQIDCPRCSNPIDIRVSVSGRTIRADHYSPAEYPDVDVTDIECLTGCILTDAEQAEIRSSAIELMSARGAEYDDCGEYDRLEDRDDV